MRCLADRRIVINALFFENILNDKSKYDEISKADHRDHK